MYPHWKLEKCDWEVFGEVAQWLGENDPPQNVRNDPEKLANWVTSVMTSACETLMPRSVIRVDKKSVHW